MIAREGDTWPDIWPPEGTMLRWRITEDDEISCERLKVEERRPTRQTPIKHVEFQLQIPKWLGYVLCFVAGAVIGAGIYGIMSRENVAPVSEVHTDHDIQVSKGYNTETVKKGETKSFDRPEESR